MNLHDQETFRRGKEEGISEGFNDGIQQGRADGEHQAKIATAKNFLSMGISVEQVAEGTGLTLAEVQVLFQAKN